MNKCIINLSRSSALRKTFRGLRLHRIYNAWLERFPRVRKIGNVIYRAKRTESVSLALEMLEGGKCYDESFLPKNITTFADLGCNVGYFACWLHYHGRGDRL